MKKFNFLNEVSKANAHSQQGCTVGNGKKVLADFIREEGDNIDFDRIYRFSSREWDLGNLFRPYLHNREHTEQHIDKMIADILNYGSLELIPPITVNIRTFTICDGDKRNRAVLQILRCGLMDAIELRVIFVDVPEEEEDEYIINLNTTSDNWPLIAYIKNFASRGYEGYQKLIDFCLDNEMLFKVKKGKKEFCPRYGIAAIGKSNSTLKTGKLELSEKDLAIGKEVVDEATELRSIVVGTDAKANGGGWLEAFLLGWNISRKTLDVDFNDYKKTLKAKMKLKKTDVPRGSNRKGDWIAFFDMINQETKRALIASTEAA